MDAREPAAVTLGTKLASVIGGRSAGAFRKAFDLVTVRDLLTHYPRRYARRGELTALDRLPIDENVTIVAEVREVRERRMRARHGTILDVRISDGEGLMTLTFFNQAWRAKELVPGVRGMFAGKVTAYKGVPQLTHPDYELFEPDDAAASGLDDTAAARWATTPIPVYPATGTVASWQLQRAIALVLDALGPVDDPVPQSVRRRHRMLDFRRALEQIHRPSDDAAWRAARDTLRRQEALILQTALLQQRADAAAHRSVSRRPRPGGLLERFDAALPFTLTDDQRRVGDEIAAELAAEHPMSRLVQGEVGSGKTLVALRAMLTTAEDGGQAALLAPTEVLAAQHLRSIADTLGPELAAELMPTLVTGRMSAAERRAATLRIASGRARIVVGTHALLGDAIVFADLGLVVVDEQHRFGVDQREALRLKGALPPHVLVLTATPIPRTIAMTVFGDLDVSTIRSLPAGRAGIETFTVPLAEHPRWEDRIWTRSAEEIAAGRQVFVVCPAIDADSAEEGDEALTEVAEGDQAGPTARPRASVESAFATARAHPALASARIGVLHGRMPSDEKDAVMRAFAAGSLDLLVATTVIEVGVDVPNASTMVVLDADRFGISQLHQLRGRVGRGSHPGLCLLVTAAPEGSLARERVDAVAATSDGFELARVDLELRREGDVLGADQSGGRSSLKLLRVVRDAELITEARQDAAAVLAEPGGLGAHPALAEAVAARLDDAERDFLAKS